ncbi:MAG: hypothetical protein IJS26_02075 [Alphaproteobacteria bacterium]|nr:hypothetical protein [Alphaproteobacteria bacterium]
MKTKKVCSKVEKVEKEEDILASKAFFTNGVSFLCGTACYTFVEILFNPIWEIELDRVVVPCVATALLLLLGSAIAKIVESKKEKEQ